MTLRQANTIVKKVAAVLKNVYKANRGSKEPRLLEREISRPLYELGYSFQRQEVFFVNSDDNMDRPRYVVIDYVVENLVIVRVVSRPENDPLEYRLLWTLMNISSTKAAVRLNLGVKNIEDAILFCDINTARTEMLPPGI